MRYYFGLMVLCIVVSACKNKKQENSIVNQSEPLVPSKQTSYYIIQDSIITLEEFGVTLMFTESTKEEFDRYNIQFIPTDLKKRLKNKISVKKGVEEILRNPKTIVSQNLIPIINWDQKLDIFLRLDQVIEQTVRMYNGSDILMPADIADAAQDESGFGEDDDDSEEPLQNTEILWFALQELGILKEQYFIRSDTNYFEVLTKKGSIGFRNSPADHIKYSFLGYYPNINACVIGLESPRGKFYKLVHKVTGQETPVWDFPEFWAASVKKNRILPVFSASTYQHPEKPDGFQLFDVQEDGVRLLFEMKLKDAMPSQMAFMDQETAILKMKHDYGYRKMTIKPLNSSINNTN